MTSATVRSTRGMDIELDSAALQGLRGGLRGDVLLPDEAGYDDARAVWNGMIDRRPGLVARCLGVSDVVAGVNFAREHGLLLSIKGGGHNISGLAVSDGGFLLDLSAMRGVWVDPEKRVARAQAGCTLGDVDRETQVHGLAAVLGFVSQTGIAGLTLGGGFGYLTRRHGWTCDNVRSMEVVTAGGRVITASRSENADLFWGLCGGGGNFGVVTSIEFNLFPVGPEIVGGAIAWHARDAKDVLEMYRAVMAAAPPELVCVAGLRIAPPAPWIQPQAHGKPIVLILVCHSGSEEEGERLVARIKSFGAPVGDVVQRRPYVTQQNLLDATQPKGRRYYWKSEYLPHIEPDMLAAAMEHGSRIRSPFSAILLFPLDGPLNDLPNDHSPVGNRDAAMVFNIAASWDDAAEDDEHIEWARAAWRDMRRFSTGGTYINFLTQEEGEERIRAAYGQNYERLMDVKTVWDPDNLFRMNKNILPRSG